jgi:hypothetical protein
MGVIHRDLTPSNLLVDHQGVPHVVDFGLAKLTSHDSSLTTSGTVLGTPSYMSPEQAAGDSPRVGPAADVYGLGTILYELLAGRPPFRGESIAATLKQVETEPPVPPRLLNASVSRNLEAICLKCLQKKPTDRYASPRELAEDLDRLLQGGRILAQRRIGAVTGTVRLLLAAGVLATLAFIGYFLFRGLPIVPAMFAGLAGGTLIWLLGFISVHVWNELLLPTWLVSRSSHPLAKSAFGLGLVLVTLPLNYPAILLLEMRTGANQPEAWLQAIEMTLGLGALVGLIGKLFCLVGAVNTSALSALFGSVIADLVAITFSMGWSGFIRLESTALPVTPWISLVGAVCFVTGLERMAASLEQPDLQRKARRLRFWIAIVCPTLFAPTLLANYVSSWLETAFGAAYLLAWVIGLVLLARAIYAIQSRILLRI